MSTLILLRHGQSAWNAKNRFTGWVDVPLSAGGRAEAAHAGRRLAAEGYRVHRAFTSALDRAIETGRIVLDALGQADLPQARAWQLNERFYGALTGRDKAATAAELGSAQVHLWRRGYEVRPPGGESLKDAAERTLPYVERTILPAVREGTVLVCAHGSSLRAIVMLLDEVDAETVTTLEIATGVPIVYDLDGTSPVAKRVLNHR